VIDRLAQVGVAVSLEAEEKLDKRVHESFFRTAPVSAGASDGEKSEIREETIANSYRELVCATLAKVTDQRVGMVPWLRQNRPMLYEKLAVQLPDKIHLLWEERAPLVEFERILDLWLEAHRASREAYLEASACRRLERE
jgi:hypothetical protein